MRLWQWICRLLGRKQQPVKPQAPVPTGQQKHAAPIPVAKPEPKRRIARKCPQTDKRMYESREIAARERDRLARNTPNNFLRIYTCEFCSHWHLTHKKRYRW